MARPVNPDSVLARRVREARERLGLSQRELGLLMGLAANVAAPRINQYERGSAAPTVDDLGRLADALGLPAAALVAEDPALVRLLRAWAEAPAKARTAALRDLEAQTRAAGRPGHQAMLKRIDDARKGWAEDANRAAQARQTARKRATAPTPAGGKVAKPAKPGRATAGRKVAGRKTRAV